MERHINHRLRMKVNNLKTVIFYRVNYKFFVESEVFSVAMHLDKKIYAFTCHYNIFRQI